MEKATVRKQAQRAVALEKCEACGATENLQRHHPDYSQPLLVQVLCQTCHTKAHQEMGDWGKGTVKPATCTICGKEFQPKRSRRAKICSEECRAEMGRRSAEKRWGR